MDFERCEHRAIEISGSERCFIAPVNSREQNRAAHGNIRVTDRCAYCGAERFRLVNGRHVETGEWFDAAGQRRRERNDWRQLARVYGAAHEYQYGYDRRIVAFRASDGAEVVIGANLSDAVRRTKTPDARVLQAELSR